HITITAERDLIKSNKNTVEEFNQTINSLQNNYNNLMTEKLQLQNNFRSLCQKNVELETRVKDLTAEKSNVTSLSGELKKASKEDGLFISSEEKSWDHGGDLVIIKTEEKQVSLLD
ncbi:hypothetical protein M9458_000566, partial [Cirrhinus mrigala]